MVSVAIWISDKIDLKKNRYKKQMTYFNKIFNRAISITAFTHLTTGGQNIWSKYAENWRNK